MPGYGVANPGSLIGFVCLVCCISTSTWPMRPSKFTPSLCTGEGGVFGGMYFYHSSLYFLPIPNATFGSSFTYSGGKLALARNLVAITSRHWAPCSPCKSARPDGCVVVLREVRVGVLVGDCAFGLLLLARCAACLPAWFAALCLLSVVSALAGFGFTLLQRGTLFWFVLCQPRAPLCPWDWGT